MLRDIAIIHTKVGGTENFKKAKSYLTEGLEIARKLKMEGVVGQIENHLKNMASEPVTNPCPDGLTGREVEVIRLVTQGKSDKEIGDELFISPKTVSNHVRNIRTKTGTANRTEAAAYGIRHGLDRGDPPPGDTPMTEVRDTS